MFKKYIRLYRESVQLAFAYPQYALFFLLINSAILFPLFQLDGMGEMVILSVNVLLKIAALGGVGYCAIKLVRTENAPVKIFSRGVKGYFWVMVKYMVLQLILISVTWVVPVSLFGNNLLNTSLLRSFWYWFVEFLFVFLIFEAIFWEDQGLMVGYRMRNIFFLDRFEWIFPVYLVAKLPHIFVDLLPYWGWQWANTFVGMGLLLLVVAVLDWVNMLFTFKVYGVDRLQVAREMEERLKEAKKRHKKGKDFLKKK